MLPMVAFLMVTIMNDAAQRLIDLVGHGKIGGGIARHALQLGLRVVGFDKKPAGPALKGAGLLQIDNLGELAKNP